MSALHYAMKGSRKHRTALMRTWGDQIARGLPKRRVSKGSARGLHKSLWFVFREERYENSQPRAEFPR